MAFSFGFYNSFNHDRKYNSIQISMIFDGIISDGIYATIGEAMVVKATSEDNTVVVGPGRGWFDHTWNYNDADLPVNAPISDVLLKRIDALVIDVNANENYRENKIMWVQGTPSSNPVRPTMINTLERHQYPLCYIERKPNVEKILQADITNMVGSSECPFVTGILQTINIDQLLLQWKDQWAQFVIAYEKMAEEWMDDQKADFEAYYTEFKRQMDAFEAASGKEFNDWFASIQDIFDGSVAGHLQNEINQITETEFLRYYGLINSVTVIDDSTNTITTTTSEATETTRFASNTDGETITTTIIMASGNYDYVKTTTIIPQSNGDRIETAYIKRPK
nr:MAG TPA: Receptor Binding Protein [Caudoviricetes sp.]